MAAAERSLVEHVVVHERRHVDELDRRRCDLDAGGRAAVDRSAEEDQRGPQPLPAGVQRLVTGARDRSGVSMRRLPARRASTEARNVERPAPPSRRTSSTADS